MSDWVDGGTAKEDGAEGGRYRGNHVFSFKYVTCAVFGDISVVTRLVETIRSVREGPSLEIRWLSGLEPMNTDFGDMGHFLKMSSPRVLFRYVSVHEPKDPRR